MDRAEATSVVMMVVGAMVVATAASAVAEHTRPSPPQRSDYDQCNLA